MECSVTRLGFFYEAAAVHFDALDMKFLSLTFDHLHSVSGSLKYWIFNRKSGFQIWVKLRNSNLVFLVLGIWSLSKICSWSSDFKWIRNRVETHSLNAKVVSMEGLLCYVGLLVFLEKTPRNFKKLRTPNIGANSHTGHFESKVLKLWTC